LENITTRPVRIKTNQLIAKKVPEMAM